jgi:hypothetical protein
LQKYREEEALCTVTYSIQRKGKLDALRPQTPQRIRGGWSHYTDTSEPVVGYGATNMARPIQDSNQRPFGYQHDALTDCATRPHILYKQFYNV